MQVETTNQKYSAKYYPGALLKWQQKGNVLYFYAKETTLEIKVISDKVMRLRYAPEGQFQRDFSYAIDRNLDISLISLLVEENSHEVRIITESVICRVNKETLGISITDLGR